MKSGQAAIETMISIGVILIFVLILYAFVFYPRVDQTNYIQTLHLAKGLCNDISGAISTVAYSGNGFTQRIYLPPTISGDTYNVTVYKKTVDLLWSKGSVICQFRARNITYAGNYPPFSLNVSEHVMNNSNGVVKIV